MTKRGTPSLDKVFAMESKVYVCYKCFILKIETSFVLNKKLTIFKLRIKQSILYKQFKLNTPGLPFFSIVQQNLVVHPTQVLVNPTTFHYLLWQVSGEMSHKRDHPY